MSLLNQVLLDLEKRNVENSAEQYRLYNIKAVNPVQKKSSYLPLGLILLTTIIVITLYSLKQVEPTEFVIKSKQPQSKKADKKVLSVKAGNSAVKSVVQQDPVIGIAVKPRQKTAETQAKDVQPVQANQHQQKKRLATKQADKKLKRVKQNASKYKKLNKLQKANKLFESATKQQNIIDKQKNLEQALTLDSRHIKARLLLSNTLLHQGLTEEAAKILDMGLVQLPQNLQLINLRSQLFLQKKQPRAALKILQQIDAGYVKDEIYLSLLAAAYQQKNAHLKSQQSYQKLLKINPEKAEYWLGLAIALERQNDFTKAVAAYEQALDKNTLKNEIVSYIEQRMSLIK